LGWRLPEPLGRQRAAVVQSGCGREPAGRSGVHAPGVPHRDVRQQPQPALRADRAVHGPAIPVFRGERRQVGRRMTNSTNVQSIPGRDLFVRMLSLLCASILLLSGCDRLGAGRAKTGFDGQAALGYVKAHLAFGPRAPGTPAHDSAAAWIVAQMKQRTDSVTVQRWTQTTADGTKLPLQNILARFNPAATQRVLYVTHWDTRPKADDDPNFGNKARPILGANDGASGVGLFLALGDVFKKTPPSVGVDL